MWSPPRRCSFRGACPRNPASAAVVQGPVPAGTDGQRGVGKAAYLYLRSPIAPGNVFLRLLDEVRRHAACVASYSFLGGPLERNIRSRIESAELSRVHALI